MVSSIVTQISLILHLATTLGLLALLYGGFEILTTKSDQYQFASLVGLLGSLIFVAFFFWLVLKNLWKNLNTP